MTIRVSPAKRFTALLLALLLALSTIACAKVEANTYDAQLDLGARYLTDQLSRSHPRLPGCH